MVCWCVLVCTGRMVYLMARWFASSGGRTDRKPGTHHRVQGIAALVREMEHCVEPALADMLRMNWAAGAEVGDQSPYVSAIFQVFISFRTPLSRPAKSKYDTFAQIAMWVIILCIKRGVLGWFLTKA